MYGSKLHKRSAARRILLFLFLSSAFLCTGAFAGDLPGEPILAYVGPGAGLGMLASVLAVLVAIVIGIFGLLLYPITLMRRMIRQRKEGKTAPSGE